MGDVTAQKLRTCGIKTIGELAVSDRFMVMELLGKHGGEIHDYANGAGYHPGTQI